ncbi:MAG: DNA polymerase III subunit gamma/tau [Clostridia bacterium]|nr:DNA polymerase III subunit gamma/tau [Clostridia bacterium]
MAYRALYRKWRPDTFDSVIGQSHITDTICNEILSGHLAHAYLFTGTRGTGKTSTAKILSRAVNCLSPKNGNPCNECECCKTILNDLSLDVLEIDAASNTGVDNIRDIIEQLQYLPTSGKYKVYIIDEVHMLSQGAFNALLKTLEEPPSHVIFILATTEVQKIPATILSRCQRFDFKTISIFDIVSNIKNILMAEGITADDDALEYVAFLGDGSMRDSLSILDQCLAFKGNNLTVGDVTDVVGAVDDAVLYDFAQDIAKSDVASALKRFNDCVNAGKNFDNIAKGLLQVLREILMFKINSGDFTVSKLKRKLLVNCADMFDITSLVRYIGIMTDCIASFKTFSSQRVLCECALIKLATPQVNTDFNSLLARIDSLENKINLISSNPQVFNTNTSIPKEKNVQSESFDDVPLPPEPPADDFEIPAPAASQSDAPSNSSSGLTNKIIANWNDVMTAVTAKGQLRVFTALFGIKPASDGDKIVICTTDEDKKRLLSEKTTISLIKDCIKEAVGVDAELVVTGEFELPQEKTDDIFQSLGNMGKDFPSNININ